MSRPRTAGVARAWVSGAYFVCAALTLGLPVGYAVWLAVSCWWVPKGMTLYYIHNDRPPYGLLGIYGVLAVVTIALAIGLGCARRLCLAASLAVVAILSAGWVRSTTVDDAILVIVHGPPGNVVPTRQAVIASAVGGIALRWVRLDYDADSAAQELERPNPCLMWHYRRGASPRYYPYQKQPQFYKNLGILHPLGFEWDVFSATPARPLRRSESISLTLPYWAATALAGFPWLVQLIGAARAWGRARGGRCRRCGYELRIEHERCPECGEPIKAASMGRSAIEAAEKTGPKSAMAQETGGTS